MLGRRAGDLRIASLARGLMPVARCLVLVARVLNPIGVVLCIALAACGSTTARAPVPAKPPAAPPLVAPTDRLPRTFTPTSYRARLALEVDTLRGSIEIAGTLAAPTRVIWLHGERLVISKARAMRANQTVPLNATAPRADTLIALAAAEPLAAGRWTLAIDYTGDVDNKGTIEPETLEPDHRAGRSEAAFGVFSEQLDNHRYWFTNSEPTYARRIFPCLDEPDRKVPWQLALDVPRQFTAASNAPIVRETPLAGDSKRIEFAPTPPLPSYLVAFATGPFEIVDGGRSRAGVPIRILGQPGRTRGAAWGLHAAHEILDRMEDWTGIAYPYAKLDLVAVPRTGTRWVAMENPGLITFGTGYLPADPAAEAMWRFVVGHELAHQWFGNLVTPAWWDDIWLNESFAVWFQAKLEKQLDPASPGAMSDVFRRSWELTARSHVRAPLARTRNGDDIGPYLDGYRGAPIVRMLEEFVGADAFQRAVRAYLVKHAHGSATTADFARALEAATGKPLGPALAAYLDRDGIPTLEPELACEPTGNQLTLRQRSPGWPIPVCIAYDRDGQRAETCIVAGAATTPVPLPGQRCPEWVLANANAAGLYAIDWTRSLAPLVERGWPQLTEPERLMLLAETRGSELAQLTVAIRLVESADPSALGVAAHTLAALEAYVPDDLVAKARARFAALPVPPALLPARDYAELGPTLLAGLAGQPAVAHEVLALAGKPDLLGALAGPALAVVLRVATTLEPSRIDTLLAGAKIRDHTRWHVVDALARAPGTLERLERDPSMLQRFDVNERLALLATRCHPAREARAASVAAKAFANEPAGLARFTTGYQKCLDRRGQLEPVFRAWLKVRRRSA